MIHRVLRIYHPYVGCIGLMYKTIWLLEGEHLTHPHALCLAYRDALWWHWGHCTGSLQLHSNRPIQSIPSHVCSRRWVSAGRWAEAFEDPIPAGKAPGQAVRSTSQKLAEGLSTNWAFLWSSQVPIPRKRTICSPESLEKLHKLTQFNHR